MANFNKNLKLLIMSTVILLEVSAISAFTTKVKAAELSESKTSAIKQSLNLPIKVENGNIKSVESVKTTPEIKRYTEDPSTNSQDIVLELGYSPNMDYKGQMPVKMKIDGISADKINSTSFKVVLSKNGNKLQEITEGDQLKKHIDSSSVYLLAYFNSGSDGQYEVEVYDNTNPSNPIKLSSQTMDLKCTPNIEERYFSTSQEEIGLYIDFIDPSICAIDKLSIELQDSSGNVVAKTNNAFDYDNNLRYESINKDNFFGVSISQHSIVGNLYRVKAIEPGNYKIILKNDGQLIDLGKDLVVNFTDTPMVDHVYVKTQGGVPLTKDQNSVDVRIAGYKINKDQFKVNLKDESGVTISSSVTGQYKYYDDQASEVEIGYKLDIPSDKPLQDGKRYSIDILSDSSILYNTDHIETMIVSEPGVADVETLNPFDGIILIKTFNLAPGTLCKAEAEQNTPEGTKKFIAEATTDSSGNIIFQFKDDAASLDLAKYDTILSIFTETDNKCISRGIIKNSVYDTTDDKNDKSITTPITISNTITEYTAHIWFQSMEGTDGSNSNLVLNKDNLQVKLVEKGNENNVVGQMDTNSMDVYSGGVSGKVKIIGKLESNKTYFYIITSDDKVYKLYNTTNVVVTDKMNVKSSYLDPILHVSGDKVIPSNTRSLYFGFDVINGGNLSPENFSVELIDAQGNEIVKSKSGSTNIYSTGTDKGVYGTLTVSNLLTSGKYYLVAKCDSSEFFRDEYLVTAQPLFGTMYIQNLDNNGCLSKSSDSLKINIYGTTNIDYDKLKLRITDLNGTEVENEIDRPSIVVNDYGVKDINFTVKLKSRLHEGYYFYQLLYDGVAISGYNSSAYKSNSFFVKADKVQVEGVNYLYDSYGKIKSLLFNGENLSSNSTYKAILYSDNGSTYFKTIEPLTLNIEGKAIIIHQEQLYELKQGYYKVYIEMDGNVIGSTNISVQSYQIPIAKSDATLADLMVNGETIKDFEPDKLEYTVEVYDRDNKGVNAVTTNPKSRCYVSNTQVFPGTTLIEVTSEDGRTTKLYKVNFVFVQIKYGDLNNDGSISDDDTSILKQTILGKNAVNDSKFMNTIDVDGDGIITSTDYTLIKRKENGKLLKLPIESRDIPRLLYGNNLIVDTEANTLEVLFNEPMDKESIETVSNYDFSLDYGNSFESLPYGATVSLAEDKMSAIIGVPSTTDIHSSIGRVKVRVLGVKNSIGNSIGEYYQYTNTAVSKNIDYNTIRPTTPSIYSDNDKVWIMFQTNKKLVSIDKNDFKISTNSSFLNELNISPSGDNAPDSAVVDGNNVTLTWNSSEDAKAELKRAGSNIRFSFDALYSNTLAEDGSPLKATNDGSYYGVTVGDKIAPVMLNNINLSQDYYSGDDILIFTFNENLASLRTYTPNHFKITVNGIDQPYYSYSSSGDNVLKIILQGVTERDPSKIQVSIPNESGVIDVNGNEFTPTAEQQAGVSPVGN